MPESLTTITNERKHIIRLDRKELELVVVAAAAECVEHYTPNIKAPGVSYTVRFEDVTEGSPSYRVGVKAVVEITEDRNPQEKGTNNE